MSSDSNLKTVVCTLALLAVAGTAWAQKPKAPAAPKITPAMLALGDSIFHGLVGGAACFGCHGPDGKGMPRLAPDLTSGTWLHSDGSFDAIMKTIETGVPQPKQAAGPMPPMGGGKLTADQLKAVAGWVYSLSHPAK
jgi:mono/diheme cytochrome c family protein